MVEQDSEVQVTVSIGIGIRRDSDTSLEEIFKRVDDMLYMAKNTGRDRIILETEKIIDSDFS